MYPTCCGEASRRPRPRTGMKAPALDDYFMKGKGRYSRTGARANVKPSRNLQEHQHTTIKQTFGRYREWYSIPFDERLKLRLDSIGFFSDDGSRDYGKTMHDIISHVKTIADIRMPWKGRLPRRAPGERTGKQGGRVNPLPFNPGGGRLVHGEIHRAQRESTTSPGGTD